MKLLIEGSGKMWHRKDGKICLDISKINQDEFRINEEDGFTFVGPKKNKWSWKEDEKRLRSLILDSDGFVVSSGFPKFGNYGEFLDDTKILNDALNDNKVVRSSHKHDGSLCIRSIIDGKIILRTRGTSCGQYAFNEEGPTFYERFYEAAEEYPELLNSNFYPGYSLLFEYVSPTNRIVLKYEETDLIFIGGIKHSDLSLVTWKEMLEITKKGKLNIVKLHTLPTDPKELVSTVYNWIGDEGVVARCNNSQTLVKIKSEDYLAKHRTKATMNYEAAAIIIRNEKITTSEEMDKYCQDKDFDWELGQDMLRYLEEYKKAVLISAALMDRAKTLIEEFGKTDFPEGKVRRKKFAQFIKEEPKHVRSVCFSLYGGSDGKLETFMNKLIENKGVGYEI